MSGKQRNDVLLCSQHNTKISQHNELVRKKQDVLKRLIYNVYFWLSKYVIYYTSKGHDKWYYSLKEGNF